MSQNAQPLPRRGMAALSRSFYETAREFTAAMSLGEIPQAIKYPSAVIVLLAACLEAYLSEFLALFRQMEPERWEAAIADLERIRDPRDRWHAVPPLFGVPTFDRGTEPFQSFHHLVALRNAVVHYSPRFRTPEEFPSETIRELRARYQFSNEGNADWTVQVLNLECARWGCRTTMGMVRGLHELCGGHDMSRWPHPWPDPP
jgi:hypothetical protein